MYTDIAIVFCFLLLSLLIGVKHSQGIKNINDFALGGRSFSTSALIATIVATWASGSGFALDLTKTYSKGWGFVFPVLGAFVGLIISFFIFIPRMGPFLGKNSIAEFAGDLYGKNVRIIVAITGIISASGSVAVQFSAFGSIMGYLLGVEGWYAIFFAGIVTTIYSAFGGIKAVTFTDFLQLLIFGCIIPVIGIIMWNHTYEIDFSVHKALQEPKFNLLYTLSFRNPDFWGTILLFCYFAIPHMKPTWFQRISMGSNIQQVKRAFAISLIVKFFLISSIIWIPFLLWNINPNLKSTQILGYVIDNYTYTGLKGLAIVAITAMSMSTADSYINSSSVMFANDICKPLNIGSNRELLFAKLFGLILGGAAIVLASTTQDLLGIHIWANSFYMPVVTPIIFLSVLGFRYSPFSILMGMAAGCSAIITWKYLGWHKVGGVIFATSLNFFFLIINKAVTFTNIKKKNTKTPEVPFLLPTLKSFFLNLLSSFKQNLPISEVSYVGLGIYLVVYTISTMYSTQVELLKEKGDIILYIYQAMIVSGMLLVLCPLWPKIKKKEIILKIIWPLVIFFELIFLSSFFVMVSNFGPLQFSIFTINVILSIILVGWKMASIMIGVGFYLSVVFYKYYAGVTQLDFSIGSPQFVFMYTLVIISTVITIFLKPKQEEQEATLAEVKYLKKEIDYAQREFDNLASGLDFLREQFNKKEGGLREKEKVLRNKLHEKEQEISKLLEIKEDFLRNIPHETNTPLTGIISFCEILYDSYDSLDSKEIKQCVKQIIKSSDRLQTYVDSIIDLSKLSSSGYKIEKSKINLKDMISCKVVSYKKHFDDERDKQKFILDLDNLVAKCDNYYIARTIEHLIVNAVNYGKGKEIKISLKSTTDNKVKFDITDYGIGISEHELNSIFDKFTVGEKTRSKAGGRGVGLALCKAKINAHEGEIYATSSKKNGTTFTFVI